MQKKPRRSPQDHKPPQPDGLTRIKIGWRLVGTSRGHADPDSIVTLPAFEAAELVKKGLADLV
jgi:hypothetical protein